MDTIEIKQATANDFRQIIDLAEDYYKENWLSEHTTFDYDHSYENLKSWSVGAHANVIVAWHNNEMIGWSVAFLMALDWSKDLRCSIGYNYIKPEYRSQGVLNKFIDNHTKWAIAYKCVDMNIGDSGTYNGKFNITAKDLGFDRIGSDCYKVLTKDNNNE